MATSKFHTQKPLFVVLSVVVVLLTMTKVNSTETVSITWDKFVPNQPNPDPPRRRPCDLIQKVTTHQG
ncbi:hypothetical protein HKD37_10G027026 [Glycine soja]